MQATTQRRKHPRVPVKWTARIDLPNGLVMGTVRDWSAGGLCFEPEAGCVDGAIIGGDRALEVFQKDERLELTALDARGKPARFLVDLRWLGRSQTHDCQALGVEFVGR